VCCKRRKERKKEREKEKKEKIEIKLEEKKKGKKKGGGNIFLDGEQRCPKIFLFSYSGKGWIWFNLKRNTMIGWKFKL